MYRTNGFAGPLKKSFGRDPYGSARFFERRVTGFMVKGFRRNFVNSS